MKPHPCIETNGELEERARAAEQRKRQAIDRLNERLGTSEHGDAFARSAEPARGTQ